MRLRAALFALLFVLSASHAGTESKTLHDLACPNAGVLGAGLITNVCWSCMFPIRLAGIDMFGNRAPSDANSNPVCACGGDLSEGRLPTIGFSLGLWQPTRLIELVRRPYCFPSLGGAQISGSLSTLGGGRTVGGQRAVTAESTLDKLGFWNFHYYSFPLLALLEIMNVPGCNVGGFQDIDVLFMGEAFPNWYNDELSFLVQPEVVLFANPAALAAMPMDCAQASFTEPIDKAFWVAGCWGSVYPFTGNLAPGNNPVRGTSLAAVRALSLMARLGIIQRTVGHDAACKPREMPILKKSQYRLQMMFPVPESKGGTPPNGGGGAPAGGGSGVSVVDPTHLMDGCCHAIGKSDLLWGAWRMRPGTGEDYVYLVWQWTDCCMGMLF